MKKCNPSNPFFNHIIKTTFFCLLLSILSYHWSFAQVKIGSNATSIQSTSILELESDSQGLLIPRLSESEVQAATYKCDQNGALGLLVFNTSKNCIQYFDTSSSGVWHCLAAYDSCWKTKGNTIGTDTLFVGSLDSQDVNFGTNSQNKMVLRTYGALDFLDNNRSVYIGSRAGRKRTTGSANTSVGYEALEDLSSGSDNVALGIASMKFNTSGSRNTACGTGSMFFNTSGSLNTGVGRYALRSNTSGEVNTAIGASALERVTTGSQNVAVGANALYRAKTSSRNVGIGYRTLESHEVGEYNTAVGQYALHIDSMGVNNTALGAKALYKNEVGGSNVALGFETLRDVAGSGNVGLGNQAGAFETGSNKLYIDNSSTSTPLIHGDFSSDDLTIYGDLSYTGSLTSLSDKHLKTNIQRLENNLDLLSHIQPYRYTFKESIASRFVLPVTPQIGLIAQEVELVYPEFVKVHETGYKSVNYAQLVSALIGAVNELNSKVIALEQAQK